MNVLLRLLHDLVVLVEDRYVHSTISVALVAASGKVIQRYHIAIKVLSAYFSNLIHIISAVLCGVKFHGGFFYFSYYYSTLFRGRWETFVA